MAGLFLLTIFSYLVGAIPTGYIVGKVGYGINLQAKGSGNTGTANTRRVLGIFPALLVLAGDLGKALFVLEVTRRLGYPESVEWWMGVCAVIGHIYPIYLKFKGGKGLATAAGLFVGKEPVTLVIFLLLWYLVYLLTKNGAFSSVLAMTGVTLYLLILGILSGIIGCLVIILRHTPEAWTFLAQQRE